MEDTKALRLKRACEGACESAVIVVFPHLVLARSACQINVIFVAFHLQRNIRRLRCCSIPHNKDISDPLSARANWYALTQEHTERGKNAFTLVNKVLYVLNGL